MHYLTDTNLNWQLIADKESKLKKLSDLSDKIVAMTRYSGTDLLTDMVVKKAKPKYQVFRVQVNDVLVRLAMLQNHEIDAYWFAEPQITKALAGDNNALFNSQDAGVHLGVVAVMDKVRRQEEEAAFASAYDKAVELINKNGVKYYSALIQKYMRLMNLLYVHYLTSNIRRLDHHVRQTCSWHATFLAVVRLVSKN